MRRYRAASVSLFGFGGIPAFIGAKFELLRQGASFSFGERCGSWHN